ncbi:MAG: excisionase family DNA-binding protein [Actinomycetia bacterium]|nr:excisionase family DNA-binding protein [Actinomycetes bacterium]
MQTERILTTARDAEAAEAVVTLMGDGRLAVEREGEQTVVLPPELGQILRQVLFVIARGGAVEVAALPTELTTTTAAGLLGISRPTLMKMIRNGEIPSHLVGTHHRLKLDDVYAARRARQERQRQAMRELMDLEGDDF